MTGGRLVALVFVVTLAVTGCAGRQQPARELVVGADPDPESVLLANIYAAALRSYGFPARAQQGTDPLANLDTGAVIVVPAFTGRMLQTLQPGATVRSDKQVYRAMVAALPEGIAAGDYATAAQDKPALAVTGATATAWGSQDLSVLSRHCDGLAVGSLDGARTPAMVGRCRLPGAQVFSDDATMFAALRAGQIAAAWTTTADPDVPADLVLLGDKDPALVQAENVVPLYRRNELTEPALLAINEVAGVLDTATLIDMRRRVGGGATPQVVADGWLAEHPLWR